MQVERGENSLGVGNICVCKDQIAGWERGDDRALHRVWGQVIAERQVMHISQEIIRIDFVICFQAAHGRAVLQIIFFAQRWNFFNGNYSMGCRGIEMGSSARQEYERIGRCRICLSRNIER